MTANASGIDTLVAFEASANPIARARELRLQRDRYLADTAAVDGIRAPILASWRRSTARGVEPGKRLPPLELGADEAAARLSGHPLAPLLPLLHPALDVAASESGHLLAVTDADGVLLSVEGDPRLQLEAAEQLHFLPGARFAEEVAGTNGIGVALAAGHPIQVFAAEHFCEHSQWWTCAAAPVRDPASGRIVGTLDLTGRMETVHPHSLAFVIAAAAMFERSLQAAAAPAREHPGARRSPAPALVRRRDVEHTRADVDGAAVAGSLEFSVLGRDRAAATLDGRALALSRRHSEILVLLADEPRGLTASQLAIALFGDAGNPMTARAEVSRLRRVLPGCIGTDPYRLLVPVQTDLVDVRAQLSAGGVAQAIERYAGPLLPRSEAPGVVTLREELEGWVRRSLLAHNDVDALWRWLSTPSGAEDIQAWKRFLANLPPDDGRRGLAAARLERLRTLYGLTPTPAVR